MVIIFVAICVCVGVLVPDADQPEPHTPKTWCDERGEASAAALRCHEEHSFHMMRHTESSTVRHERGVTNPMGPSGNPLSKPEMIST
jgi:hypothetical protein